MMFETDKSPATRPASPYAGDLSRKGYVAGAQWSDILSPALCNGCCPQYLDRKKHGRCTLQAIDVVPGEKCSLLKRFLSGIKCPIED